MKHCRLSYKGSSISYYRIGTGTHIAFCFHGYGEDGSSYDFFEKHAGLDYTFYAIDLPFHGKTVWNEGLNFTHTDLQSICDAILDNDGHSRNQPLLLMGFSLGGRVALSLYQAQPTSIERIILLAPDGLKVNFWYWLATQSWMGNKFFGFTMRRPLWFFTLLKGMNKLGLVNASIFKFVNYYIGDKVVREALYNRWTCLRKLKPNLKKVKARIREQQTSTWLTYGKHDRIILSSVGDRFRKGIEEYCKISVIHSGHQVLHEKHMQEILPALARE